MGRWQAIVAFRSRKSSVRLVTFDLCVAATIAEWVCHRCFRLIRGVSGQSVPAFVRWSRRGLRSLLSQERKATLSFRQVARFGDADGPAKRVERQSQGDGPIEAQGGAKAS